jgi:hypothetical protein
MKYLIIAVLLCSCTNKKGASKALKDAGLHPIQVKGYGWFDCGKDDIFATRFKAYSPDCTRVVSGCVCEGIFKSKTIRFD